MGYLDKITADVKTEKKSVNVEKPKNTSGFTVGSVILLVILLVVGVVISMLAKFSGSGALDLKEITINSVIYAVIVYTIFIECTAIGKRRFKMSDEHDKVVKDYQKRLEDIENQGIANKLESFCEEYSQNLLEKAQLRILKPFKLSLEQLADYRNGNDDGFSEEQKKALKKALKVKAFVLTEEMIYHPTAEYEDGAPIHESWKIILYTVFNYVQKFFTTAISILFAFSIGYELITNISAEIIFRALLQLCVMVSSIFSGISFGVKQSQKWNDRQADINRVLDVFFRWEKQNKIK